MKLECCVGSLDAARIISKFPIHRIETCIALEQGGLTPTESMAKWIHQTFQLEQHVLIRQRAGGFVYNYDEIVVMRDQVLAMKSLGIKGVVLGALTSNNTIDLDAIETWKRAAGNLELTFHRAFDQLNDWKQGIDTLIQLGFTRILTSGGESKVGEGIQRIQEMIDYSNGKIEIMAGGGLQPDDVDVLRKMGCDAIHFSGTIPVEMNPNSTFAETLLIANQAKIEQFLMA